MEVHKIVEFIYRGRTDYIFELLKISSWKDLLHQGQIKPLQWPLYYGDATGLKAAGSILTLLCYDHFQIGEINKFRNISDHGQGWGNSMIWKLFGDYLTE
jgi:hypothetical protein